MSPELAPVHSYIVISSERVIIFIKSIRISEKQKSLLRIKVSLQWDICTCINLKYVFKYTCMSSNNTLTVVWPILLLAWVTIRLRVPVKCETKQKRNGTKRNRSKRNETNRNETKRNKTKRNKSKRNKTNDMTSHCGQISMFSNTRKSFYIRKSFYDIRNSFSNIKT